MNVNSFDCEFDGTPQNFKELLELLKPYKKYENIKDILRDIHSDKRKSTCNIEQQNCLLTTLTGYKDWLNRQDPPDTDYSLSHCIELSNPPNSNFLFSPVFSTPKMTSKFLKQQAIQLFNETFPGLDFNECMRGNVNMSQIITPTMEEFEKNFNFNDPSNINKHACFLSYYRYCVNLQFEELQNIVFILRLSKLLEMYDNEVITSGVQTCTLKRNSKRTKRKKGGGPDDLIASSTWLSWLQTTFKVNAGIIAAVGMSGFICSDLMPNVCLETVQDSYIPVIAGLCTALTTLVALNTEPFGLERKRHFSSTQSIRRVHTERGDKLSRISRNWYNIFMKDQEEILTPIEVNSLLQSIVGHIMHTSVAQTSDIDKFKLLLHEKLTLHYQSGYELAIEQATEMMKARKMVEQMSQQELDDYKDGMAVASINDLARRAVISQGEIDAYQQKIKSRFTQIIVDSILTKISDEINLAKEGVRLSSGFYREKNAEIRQKTKDDKLASTMGYIMASAVLRECSRGNLIDRGFVTEKVFNNTVLTSMFSIGMFAMKQLGAPSIVLGAGFIGLMYSITKLLSSGSEDQMHAWQQIVNSDENTELVSTEGMSIEDRELIAQAIFKNATLFYNKTITDAEKEGSTGWSISSVTTPSAWMTPIKVGYWNTRWYFSNIWHHPLMSSLYYEKLYKSSGDLGKYLGGGLALVSLAFAGNALCTSYSNHRNAVVIAKEELESKMGAYTFQLKRLQDLLDEEGGTPKALQLLIEKEHDIMKVVRDMSQIKTSHQLALANSIQAITAGEDIRVKEQQLYLGREQLGISTELLALKHAKSSAMNSLVDKLTEHVHEISQHQTSAIEKIVEQMGAQTSSLQESITTFSSESFKSHQQQRSELLRFFKELQLSVSEQGQPAVTTIDKLIHQLVTSKEDHKEDIRLLIDAVVGSKSQDKEAITELIHQLSENGQRNSEELRAAIAHTERFCISADNGLSETVNSLQKQVDQVVELLGLSEFKTEIDELEVLTKPIVLKSKLSEEELLQELQDRFKLLVDDEKQLPGPQALYAVPALQALPTVHTVPALPTVHTAPALPTEVQDVDPYDVEVNESDFSDDEPNDVQFVGNEIQPLSAESENESENELDSENELESENESENELDSENDSENELEKSVSFGNPIASFPSVPAETPIASFPSAPAETPIASFPSVPSEAPIASFPSVPAEAPIASFPSVPAKTPELYTQESSVKPPLAAAIGGRHSKTKKYRHVLI